MTDDVNFCAAEPVLPKKTTQWDFTAMHGIVNVSLRGDGKIRKGMLLMYWSDLTQNWSLWFSRFKAQFPNLDDASMPFLKLDRNRFEAHLAETHDMTLNEAREAVTQNIRLDI